MSIMPRSLEIIFISLNEIILNIIECISVYCHVVWLVLWITARCWSGHKAAADLSTDISPSHLGSQCSTIGDHAFPGDTSRVWAVYRHLSSDSFSLNVTSFKSELKTIYLLDRIKFNCGILFIYILLCYVPLKFSD